MNAGGVKKVDSVLWKSREAVGDLQRAVISSDVVLTLPVVYSSSHLLQVKADTEVRSRRKRRPANAIYTGYKGLFEDVTKQLQLFNND